MFKQIEIEISGEEGTVGYDRRKGVHTRTVKKLTWVGQCTANGDESKMNFAWINQDMIDLAKDETEGTPTFVTIPSVALELGTDNQWPIVVAVKLEFDEDGEIVEMNAIHDGKRVDHISLDGRAYDIVISVAS